MKLRRLTGSSTVKEASNELFTEKIIYPIIMNKDQITDLLNRLIYRLKQKEELQVFVKKENVNKPCFIAGNTLPTI